MLTSPIAATRNGALMMPRDDGPRHVSELLAVLMEQIGAPDHVVRRARLMHQAHVAEAENAGRQDVGLTVIDLRDDAGPAEGLLIRCAPHLAERAT